MNTEAYWLLFVDTFCTNLAINPNDEVIIYVMSQFPTYKTWIMLLVFLVAKILACLANYCLGIVVKGIIFSIKKNSQGKETNVYRQNYVSNYEIMKSICDKYYWYLVIPAFLPFYSKIMMTCFGISRSKILVPAIGMPIIQVSFYIFYTN